MCGWAMHLKIEEVIENSHIDTLDCPVPSGNCCLESWENNKDLTIQKCKLFTFHACHITNQLKRSRKGNGRLLI